MLYFSECTVAINNTGVTCESVSIDSQNSLTPIYVLGKQGIISQSPNGPITNKFNLNYYVDLKREPTYGVSNLIKTLQNDVSHSGISISIGGITGRNCYLDSYSLSVQPNDLVRANASYTSFRPLVGNLAYLSGNYYETLQTFGHANSTFILGTGDVRSLPVFGMDYSFNANWQPTYILGKAYPTQVNLMDGSEEINILTDRFQNIRFSGENARNRLFLSSPTIDNGLVGYWSFNEGQGSGIYDYSNNGNHGFMYGSLNGWTGGMVGKGFYFDRTGTSAGNTVAINYSPQFNRAFSVSAWLTLGINDISDYVQFNIIGDWGHHSRYVRFSNKYTEIAIDQTQENGFASYWDIQIQPNEWFFFTATYNGNNATVYKNGISFGSIAVTGGNANWSGNLSIGSRMPPGYTTEYWSGKMDEVRLYNRVLTTGEIQTLYNYRNDSIIDISGLAVTCNGSNAAGNSGFAGSFAYENVPGLQLDISGYKITNVNVDAQTDNFVTVKTNFRRYF